MIPIVEIFISFSSGMNFVVSVKNRRQIKLKYNFFKNTLCIFRFPFMVDSTGWREILSMNSSQFLKLPTIFLGPP